PGGLNILEKYDGTPGTATASDIHFQLLKNNRSESCAFGDDNCTAVNIFNAEQIEVDVKLGRAFPIAVGSPLAIDLGIPALGFDASFSPQVTLEFHMNFGFGVDVHKGFYFVTDGGDASNPDNTLLHIGALVTLSTIDCNNSTTGTPDRATADGRLLVLALHLKDGTDLNGDGAVTVPCVNTPQGYVPDTDISLQTMEISSVFFSGNVNFAEGAGQHGELTLGDLISGGLGSTFEIDIHGGADLRADAIVDFSTLGPDFAQILPSISAKIL